MNNKRLNQRVVESLRVTLNGYEPGAVRVSVDGSDIGSAVISTDVMQNPGQTEYESVDLAVAMTTTIRAALVGRSNSSTNIKIVERCGNLSLPGSTHSSAKIGTDQRGGVDNKYLVDNTCSDTGWGHMWGAGKQNNRFHTVDLQPLACFTVYRLVLLTQAKSSACCDVRFMGTLPTMGGRCWLSVIAAGCGFEFSALLPKLCQSCTSRDKGLPDMTTDCLLVLYGHRYLWLPKHFLVTRV
ncbi:hypothetical protein RRG08_011147 [Elysia crispata]|uniref:Uncharacterized protein n=1 Tax=Elysia crispata TaxID=231223 RepID=A0AAE1A0L8_9GAST|nr:hypothetical protein RRG08_011147 [Elysia crispata]